MQAVLFHNYVLHLRSNSSSNWRSQCAVTSYPGVEFLHLSPGLCLCNDLFGVQYRVEESKVWQSQDEWDVSWYLSHNNTFTCHVYVKNTIDILSVEYNHGHMCSNIEDVIMVLNNCLITSQDCEIDESQSQLCIHCWNGPDSYWCHNIPIPQHCWWEPAFKILYCKCIVIVIILY